MSSIYRIGKTYQFEAGHHLPSLPDGHKCKRPHGHSYRVEVILEASTLEGPGFVTDFAELAPFKTYLDRELDHQNLNDVLPVEPTSENLARYLADWFADNVEDRIHGLLAAVRVSETGSSWAEYTR